MDESTDSVQETRDWRAGFITFGIIELIIGGFCTLMLPLMLIGMLTAKYNSEIKGMNQGSFLPAILMYLVFAVWFGWMGIGSIQCKRWARALMLTSSWFWFLGGLSALLFMAVIMPDMFAQARANQPIPAAAMAVIKFITFAFMTLIYVILPLAFILFYGNRHAKATCERRDPHVRWTDRCPLPVLALSLISVSCAAWMPFMGTYGWAVPFFGIVLTGTYGAIVVITLMFMLGFVAWGLYKLNMKAWIGSLLLSVGWGVSSIITFSRISMVEYYEKMNFQPQQLEIVKPMAERMTPWMIIFPALWVVAGLMYLLYVRKYFVQGPDRPAIPPPLT